MPKIFKETFVDALRIFLALVILLFFAATGYQITTGKSPYRLVSNLSNRENNSETQRCSTQPPLNLDGAPNAQLEKLSVYQKACGSFAAGTMMTFVGIPASDADAATEAKQTAATLRAFAAYHVRPLVVAEPTDYVSGTGIDMGQFASGAYSGNLAALFADLKALHITDRQMGVWNPFPEANLPYWSNNQPQDFAPSVNLYVDTLHQYFPSAQTSIMLSAASYQPTDTTLKNAAYASLMPYLKGIAPGSINYFGLEGFPWLAPRGQSDKLLDAGVFLKPSLASEAAKYLGTSHIWLNTGTFSAQYTQDATKIVRLSTAQRAAILTDIDTQARVLQKQGFSVAVSMFAEDKSNTTEAVDWSYWNSNNPSGSAGSAVFTGFVHTLHQQQIDFWLFDQ